MASIGREEIRLGFNEEQALICTDPDTVRVVLGKAHEIGRRNQFAVLVDELVAFQAVVIAADRRRTAVIQQYQTFVHTLR